jgi:hypothetical protein
MAFLPGVEVLTRNLSGIAALARGRAASTGHGPRTADRQTR